VVARTRDVQQRAALADLEAFIALPASRERALQLISGGAVLPGFSVPVNDIFPPVSPASP